MYYFIFKNIVRSNLWIIKKTCHLKSKLTSFDSIFFLGIAFFCAHIRIFKQCETFLRPFSPIEPPCLRGYTASVETIALGVTATRENGPMHRFSYWKSSFSKKGVAFALPTQLPVKSEPKSFFKNGPFPDSFSLFSCFLFNSQLVDKTLAVLGFELQISGDGSNRSTSWATTTAPEPKSHFTDLSVLNRSLAKVHLCEKNKWK